MENRRGPVEAPRDRGHLKGAPLAMARVAAPLVATALVATALALAAPALAGVVLNTINRSAALNDAGRLVEVSGPIRCSQLEQASIRVTVSQRRTGAVAEGRWRGECRRTTRRWAVRSFTHGSAAFATGRAQACALGVTRRGSKATDAKQWCRAVRLTKR